MTLSNRWNRFLYRLWAPAYDLVAAPLEEGRRRAIERLAAEPGDRILIPGCGTGADLEHLPREARITAVDVTPAMVRRTVTRSEALGSDAGCLVGDAQALPFEDGAFDAVLLHLVLSVAPRPDAVVAEAARVLDPDGRISIFDKFVPDDRPPSLLRRMANPAARVLFSDLNRRLGPMVAGTGLELEARETVFGGLYTVTVARPGAVAGGPAAGERAGDGDGGGGGSVGTWPVGPVPR